MSTHPDHEFEELEDDSRIPPRPEEDVADAEREGVDAEDAATEDARTTEQPI